MAKVSCQKIEGLIHRYVNRERKKRHLQTFKSNYGLKRLARGHSKRMSNKKRIWHGNGVHLAGSKLTKKGFWDWIASLFYRGASGENVAMMPLGRVRGVRHQIKSSKDVATQLHKSWMNSAGHRRNILNSNFSLIGIGVKRRGNNFYATQIFYG